jgi:hypothetical protein
MLNTLSTHFKSHTDSHYAPLLGLYFGVLINVDILQTLDTNTILCIFMVFMTWKLQFHINALVTNYTDINKVKILSKVDVTYFAFALYAFRIFDSSVNLITGNMFGTCYLVGTQNEFFF